MKIKSKSKPFKLILVYPNGDEREILVKASERKVAVSRALKRNPGAVSVKNG